jgi:2-oxoisovalerate dehydrogenase E1 component alpha subunit
MQALESAEVKAKPDLSELFTDVYAEKPAHLQEQEREMLEHIAKYPDKYTNSPGH